MSTNRVSPKAGWVSTKQLPKGPGGRSLCRQCNREVPKGRRSFCNQDCVDAWVVKTNPTEMRRVVFKRDQGICAACGFDTKTLADEYRRLKGWSAQREFYRRHGLPEGRREFWDADHIVPVIEGGGECGIDNIRTLCIPCHKQSTRELATRRAARRRQERFGHLGVQKDLL